MAFTWLIVAVAVVVFFVLVFKTQDIVFIFTLIRKYFFLILALGIILFFSFSFYHIYTTNVLDLKSFNGITYAGKVYLSWLGSVFKNIGEVTGYVINQDWFSNNNSSKPR